MLNLFALLLPFSMCIVWSVVLLMRGRKHSSYLLKMLLAIMLLSALYFFCDANIVYPGVSAKTLVLSDVLMRFAALSLFPMVCFFIKSLTDDNPVAPVAYLLLLPALLMGTATIMIYGMMGFDEVALVLNKGSLDALQMYDLVLVRAQSIVCTYLYGVLMSISLLVTFCFIVVNLINNKFIFGHIKGFIGGKPSLVANVVCSIFIIFFVICILRMYVGRIWMIEHQGWASVFSIAMFFVAFAIGYVCIINPLPGGYINLDRLTHPFDAMRESRQEYIDKIDSGPVAALRHSGMDRLQADLNVLINEKKIFLNPTLTIEDLSKELGTNRTYVSKFVNLTYGMPFRDYLNKLRLDHAKRLMLDEPDAVLDYISSSSGYNTLSQFIRKFKEVEGVTPTTWRNAQRGK